MENFNFYGNFNSDKSDVKKSLEDGAGYFKDMVDAYMVLGFTRREAIQITTEIFKSIIANNPIRGNNDGIQKL